MATKPRAFIVGEFYHVYNRAADKRIIFYTEKDYEYFLNKVLFFKEKTDVKIIAYCVLPNHWHFLFREPRSVSNPTGWTSQISRFVSLLSNSYTKYFNLNKDHSGRILQGPFKSKRVFDDDYLQVLVKYINLNPVKHKIVKKIEDWPYVSHHNYVGNNKHNLIDKDYLLYLNNIDEEF
ncbi:hypothetical protein HN670_02135 [bacterium]|jgi:REP element-mobilizing transposase RayT|nr:hypothetical protein [bacterium]